LLLGKDFRAGSRGCGLGIVDHGDRRLLRKRTVIIGLDIIVLPIHEVRCARVPGKGQ
jgi:hypothetical protein